MTYPMCDLHVKNVLCTLSYSTAVRDTDIIMNISVCYKLVYLSLMRMPVYIMYNYEEKRVSISRVRQTE